MRSNNRQKGKRLPFWRLMILMKKIPWLLLLIEKFYVDFINRRLKGRLLPFLWLMKNGNFVQIL